jgi:hypothetical protein
MAHSSRPPRKEVGDGENHQRVHFTGPSQQTPSAGEPLKVMDADNSRDVSLVDRGRPDHGTHMREVHFAAPSNLSRGSQSPTEVHNRRNVSLVGPHRKPVLAGKMRDQKDLKRSDLINKNIDEGIESISNQMEAQEEEEEEVEEEEEDEDALLLSAMLNEQEGVTVKSLPGTHSKRSHSGDEVYLAAR